MPPDISNDRKELMRKIAQDGRRILELEAKLAKLPNGSQREAVRQQFVLLMQAQNARFLRIRGVARG